MAGNIICLYEIVQFILQYCFTNFTALSISDTYSLEFLDKKSYCYFCCRSLASWRRPLGEIFQVYIYIFFNFFYFHVHSFPSYSMYIFAPVLGSSRVWPSDDCWDMLQHNSGLSENFNLCNHLHVNIFWDCI